MAKTLFESSDIRNIALVGHGSSGKTTIGEAILLKTGVTTRFGNTTAGTSTFDFEPEEIKRGGSNATAFAWCEYTGKKVNIIDTPGDGNFIYDSFTAMRGADTAVVVISAPDSVEVQTERAFAEAKALGLARILVINKMDKERANVAACLADIKEELGITPVQLQIPMGAAETFKGIISLVHNKAFVYDGATGKAKETPIPAEYESAVEAAWETLIEAIAETDDVLMDKYLETMELSPPSRPQSSSLSSIRPPQIWSASIFSSKPSPNTPPVPCSVPRSKSFATAPKKITHVRPTTPLPPSSFVPSLTSAPENRPFSASCPAPSPKTAQP